MLQTAGPDALHAALSAPTDLADAVIAAQLSEYTNKLDTVEGRLFATRRAAEVIAALPDSWIERTTRLVDQTGIAKATAMSEVIDAVEAWTADPRGLAKKHLAERTPILCTSEPATADTSADTSATRPPVPAPPAQRWAALADSVHAGLSSDPHWPALARTIEQAAAGGINVQTLLPDLLADNPLPDTHPARSLDFRLIDAAGDVTRPTTRRPEPISRDDDEAAARTRRAAADRQTADRRRPPPPPARRAPVEPDRTPPASPPPVEDPRRGRRR